MSDPAPSWSASDPAPAPEPPSSWSAAAPADEPEFDEDGNTASWDVPEDLGDDLLPPGDEGDDDDGGTPAPPFNPQSPQAPGGDAGGARRYKGRRRFLR